MAKTERFKESFDDNQSLKSPLALDYQIQILKSVKVTRGINYVEFPILNRTSVEAGFSWGSGSNNQMSDVWEVRNLKARGEKRLKILEQAKINVLERQKEFLNLGKMAISPYVAQIISSLSKKMGRSYKSSIKIITQKEVNKHISSQSKVSMRFEDSFLVTKVIGLTLQVNPADCYSYVITAKDRDGNTVLGLLHGGRDEVNEELPKKAILKLGKMRCDLSTVKIAVCPGVSNKNYFIKEKHKALLKIKAKIWGNRLIMGQEIEGGEKVNVIYLDLLGGAIDQFMSVPGIKPNQIQVYDVDTYEEAKRGNAWSHRFWIKTNSWYKKHQLSNPNYAMDNGRFIVAAMIKKQ